jgi:hypothetical protein
MRAHSAPIFNTGRSNKTLCNVHKSEDQGWCWLCSQQVLVISVTGWSHLLQSSDHVTLMTKESVTTTTHHCILAAAHWHHLASQPDVPRYQPEHAE